MSSKAEVLYSLKNKNKHFKVPKMIYFNRRQWDENKKLLIKKIKYIFKGADIAIRSSSIKEDTKFVSNAGRYLSYLNISSTNKNLVSKKIDNIFSDYISKHKKNNKDQILIQEMIENVKMSGVIFSQDLENGAPYYCINYDDISGKTNTVTSGTDRFSNKSLYILRNKEKVLKSERFKKIIKAVKELEKKLNSDRLDIEFSLNKKGDFILFQVRSLKKIKSLSNSEKNKLISKISKIEKSIASKIKKKKRSLWKEKYFWNYA